MNSRSTTDLDHEIGKAIRLRREALGLTQTQLASKIGVTFQQVQKYERAVNRVSASKLVKVAETLECHITDLIGVGEAKDLEASELTLLGLWRRLSPDQQDAMLRVIRVTGEASREPPAGREHGKSPQTA